MERQPLEPDFEVIELAPDQPVDLRNDPMIRQELRPIQLYVLPKGTVDNKKSFTMILRDVYGFKYYAQISERMIRDACLDMHFRGFSDHDPEQRKVGADEEIE